MAKLAIIGDSSVGKTNLLIRYINTDYQPTHISTIGIDFKLKTVDINGYKLKLQIWDTAGSEKFRSLSQIYYKKAAAVCLTYDVTSMASFEALEHWVKELEDNTHQDIIKYVVGNKCDLNEDEEVNVKVASNFAKNIGGSLFFVSAK